jgi:hypothetical protein
MNSLVGNSQRGIIILRCQAGKLVRDEQTGKITSDPRHGSIYLLRDDEGNLHFCWKDHAYPNPEDDVLINRIGPTAELKRIPQCSDACAYVLKYKEQRLFYWIQQTRSKEDEDSWCSKVNDLLLKQTPSIFVSNLAANIKLPTLPEKELVVLLSPKSIESLLNDPSISGHLHKFLPQGYTDLAQAVRSSPFIHTVKALDRILKHGNREIQQELFERLGLQWPQESVTSKSIIRLFLDEIKKTRSR